MSTPEQRPETAPDVDATSQALGPAPSPAVPDADASPAETGSVAPSEQRRRTHPITPLVTGWKIVIGVVAVISAQNIARLIDDFTVTRALIGAGVLVAAIVVAIAFSALVWWFTTYMVDEDGVSLHMGVISKSREYAPRARIESVSVERPLLARILGLAKVRVEVAGGGESYLDIEYVKSADAEDLRRRILGVATSTSTAVAGGAGAVGAGDRAQEADVDESVDTARGATGAASSDGAGNTATSTSGGTLQEVLYDGVTDGELIAKIPTERLVRSLLRDVGFLLGIVVSIVGVAVAIILAIWQDGLSFAVIIALLPTAIAVPKYVFGRIESGWGFISRITDRGLRMRRGLANTRTDNIASGRIQRFELRRPLLWRTPDWTAVSVTVAGIDDDSENGAQSALPVGTREELWSTLGHLAAPLGTADDLATLEHLLTAPAREITGVRTPIRAWWIARRTQVTVLLPGALIHRSGIVSRTVQIVPRERIQELTLEDDPFGRKLGVLDLKVGIAGYTLALGSLAREDALALHGVLARDARRLRRYQDREHWPQPALRLLGSETTNSTGADSQEVR
ncbi:PH domain-containing protein [Brachybacterium sp. FME24]|uniref:PH domain-containing protein n=1 Tax=Brachybacterium sp. FME24 TaxID=2742605 RepID=UPI001866C27C|nr:PH domain-containing protein [Brachybacterium sp. FME24]